MSVYNKKDLLRINQEIGETGQLRNESSLDYALSVVKQKKSWLYELSYLVRSLLVDHAFADGNKRTAYTLAVLYFEDNGGNFDKNRLIDVILKISRKNVSDINKIVRELKKC
jgi:death-on-curing family protein